ncbi:hypothetical protein SLS62_009930 [Diatrype stigma]|uniref:NAD(P)-binding domain-containing protein n=1 Tax=Diatrype stigma TaxID=117547 RepID=A0AAN9YIE3_9PEZI
MSKLLLIGATGHVGGAVLDILLEKAYPSIKVEALVRSGGQARRLTAKYPSVQCTIGNLDSLDTIQRACSEADIVINAAPDITHDDGIQAILSGLKKGAGRKGYYIHTSGAYLVIDTTETGGLKDARVWDDVADIKELVSMPHTVTHAVTDGIVRSAWPEVNVAIVAPGFISGVSPSISHPCPLTTEHILKAARALKRGFQIESGENQLGFVHVLDLADMYMLLISNALVSLSGGSNDTTTTTTTTTTESTMSLWGPEAYYFGVAENMSFREFMGEGLAPAMLANGIIESADIVSTSSSEVARAILHGDNYASDAPAPPPDSWASHVAAALGLNMRIVSSRMKKLGWMPKQGPLVRSFDDAIPLYLRLEKEKTV